ncbi:MAG: TetR/AcrR family transcriptional regulator [Hyphomicrobiales bacterium]|nr:TetR/AcrR family transcriptional regulator [Hyphomicrobiales bacterium]
MTQDKFYISVDDPPAKRGILEEGLRLFAERGLSATSIRDIARATGYSNPALYKHFATKEALALTLFERTYGELMTRVSFDVKQESGFASRFRAYVAAFIGFYDDHPHAMIFVTDNLPVLWPQVSEGMRRRTIITMTRELLKQGRQEGLVTKGADLPLQLILVIGTLGQLTRQLYLRAMEGPAAKHAAGIEQMLRAGLASA